MALESVPVTLQAAAPVEGESQPGPAKFQAIAYSGQTVSRLTSKPMLKHDYVLDLKGMSVDRSVIGNLDHKADQRTGHADNVQIDGKQVLIEGVLSASTPHRDQVVQSSKDGFPWQLSIEAELQNPRLLKAGATEVINVRTVSGPLYIVGKSKLTGYAFVSHGADSGNQVTIAAAAAGENEMNEFEKFLVACGVDPETASDAQKATLQAAFDAQVAVKTKPATRSANSFAELAETERRDNERCEKIKSMGHLAMKDNPNYIDQIEHAVSNAIGEKMDIDRFELQLLRSLRSTTGTFQTAMHHKVDDTVTVAAICMSAGLPDIEKHFEPKILEAVDRHKMRGYGLQQLLLRTACSNGYHAVAGERINVGNIRSVLEHCFPPATARMAGGFSTVSLPGVLGSVANKEILAGFTEDPMEWKEVAAVKSVNNFHAVTSYRMNDSLEYEEVGPTGEIKHGSVSEESYTRQAKTYAKMLGLTRADIINDDLGAFDDIRTRLGRGASRKLSTVFWTRFMNNASFFTLARANLIEGATTNLGVNGVGLAQGVLAFRKLKSADGKRISGKPSILLVPPELETVADGFYTSLNVNTGGAATAESVPNNNTYKGKYRPVVVDYLSDIEFTGNSTTAWYLLRDPKLLAAVVVSFLNGQQSPTIESTDADFNTLGILFRGVHDFGCDFAETLAGVRSKGAT